MTQARKNQRGHHIVTDTQSNLLASIVHAPEIQDRDGAVSTIAGLRANYPTTACLFAGGGYAGNKLERAVLKTDGSKIEVVK